jgi:hypothetical protein
MDGPLNFQTFPTFWDCFDNDGVSIFEAMLQPGADVISGEPGNPLSLDFEYDVAFVKDLACK